jgi:transposase
MDKSLFVGVDIHRQTNVCCFLNAQGQAVHPRLQVENNRAGTERFVQKVVAMMEADGFSELRVAVEATGWYWFHFFQSLRQDPRLAEWDPQLFALNPRLAANFKRTYTDKDKTDPNDAFTIADRLRFGRDVAHAYHYDEPSLALRFLTRYRYHLAHQLAREKAYCLAILFLHASEYSHPEKRAFAELFGVASQAVLSEFASIEEVAALPFAELVEFIDKAGKRRFPEPEQNAKKLLQLAQDSYRLPEGLRAPVRQVLSFSLKHIQFLEQQQQRVERAIAERFQQIPDGALLLTIPGLGPIFSAGLLAEIGNVERFAGNESKVAKYAGFKWRKHQSGNFSAEETRLSKTGNAYLRYYFCEGANSVRKQDSAYAAYYQQKYREVRLHAHKRATVLTARKLVRLVVRLLASHQPYQTRRS